jgi:hypothetical protein
MRRANFMPLSSHAKGSEIAAGRRPADFDVLDPSRPWSVAEVVEKLLEQAGGALGFHLHGAIVSIPDVALEAQPPGMPFGEKAEANALDVTEDLRL